MSLYNFYSQMKVSTMANWPIPPELQRDSSVTRPSVAHTPELDLCLSGYGKYQPSNKISSGSPDSSPVHLYFVLGGKSHCDSTVPCPRNNTLITRPCRARTQIFPVSNRSTVEPRFNEVAGDRPNLFVKWRVRYIEVLFHTFYCNFGRDIVRYIEDFVK